MWQTRSGLVIFVPQGRLARLVPELKKAGPLWRAVTRSYRGSLSGAMRRVLGVLARRGEDRGIWQGSDGYDYRVFETFFAGQNYDLWTRPSGLLVAIRLHSADWAYEFEGEPGASPNAVHEQLVSYLRGLFEARGYTVRENKELGRMVNREWKILSGEKPDLQVTDGRGNTHYIEVDSKRNSGRAHREKINEAVKRADKSSAGTPVALVHFNFRPGDKAFTTDFIDNQLGSTQIAGFLRHMDQQKWKLLNVFSMMRRQVPKDSRAPKGAGRRKQVSKTRAVRPQRSRRGGRAKREAEIAEIQAARINRPPNISGAVRRTPYGGRHLEHEFYSEPPN